MTHRMRRAPSAAALLALLGTAWSGAGHACSSEPYLSSVCLMAWGQTASFNNTYMPAAGQVLSVSQYQALFALLGTTYGGNGQTTFQLPDLRGRVVVGVGQGAGLPSYAAGQVGGTANVSLTLGQLPMHAHLLTTGPTGVTVNAGVGTLAASTSLSGVTASAAGSGLTLNANSGTAGTGTPTGAALATPAAPSNKIYLSGAPNVAMVAGSISGTAPVTFGGTGPTTTLAGAPSVTIGGQTEAAGGSQPFSIMPPYLALNYYIAYSGLFPSRD